MDRTVESLLRASRFVDLDIQMIATEVEPLPEPVARRSLQRGTDGAARREPTAEESYILALAQIDNELKSSEALYSTRISQGQRKEIDSIVSQIREGGLTVDALLGPDAMGEVFRFREKMRSDLRGVLDRVRKFGGAQVRDEIQRGKERPTRVAYNENHDEQGRFASSDISELDIRAEKEASNPNHAPAGTPDGGQFTSGEDGGAPISQSIRPSASTPSEAGYVYHATNQERAQEILDGGTLDPHRPNYGTDQSSWPDRSTEKRSYWIGDAGHAWQFAPEDGKSVLLRVRDVSVPHTESTGDRYARKPIPTSQIEILTTHGWVPLKK